MKDKRVEEYIDTLNGLYFKTGLLVEAETEIYEINQPKANNRIVAILKWNDFDAMYYAEYVDIECK